MNREEDIGLSSTGHSAQHSGPWTGVHRLLGQHMLLQGLGYPLHDGNPWSPGDAGGGAGEWKVRASARLVPSHPCLPPPALPILTRLGTRVAKALIFTIIYKAHLPSPALWDIRIAGSLSQRARQGPSCLSLTQGIWGWTRRTVLSFSNFPGVILLQQWSPTFLALETSFVEDNFSVSGG